MRCSCTYSSCVARRTLDETFCVQHELSCIYFNYCPRANDGLYNVTHYPRRLYSRRRLYSIQSRLFVCLSVCLFVRALKGKRLELSTPSFVHIYSIAVARHALTQRSKGQRSRSHGYENRHARTVASDACCYGRVLLLLGLHVDTTAYVFLFYRVTTFPDWVQRQSHDGLDTCFGRKVLRSWSL